MASSQAEMIAWKYAMELRSKKKHPAAVVCAENSFMRRKDRSGPVPYPLAPQLTKRLRKIGEIGEKAFGNYLGCCAEVRAANKILLPLFFNKLFYKPRISFSNAFRPRTMQIVPMCHNCQSTFNN